MMIAYSALVNPEVEKECQDAGFDFVIESPLTTDKIQTIILPKVEERKSLFMTYQQIMCSINDKRSSLYQGIDKKIQEQIIKKSSPIGMTGIPYFPR